MGNVFLNPFSMRAGEWILNVATFLVRPIYRKIIKTKVGRKIVFKLGNIESITRLTAFFCYNFNGIISIILMCIIELISNLVRIKELSEFLRILSFIFTMLAINLSFLCMEFHLGQHWEALTDCEDSCLWFDNPEDFCKYHDGYFRKEKMVYRIWLHLGKKKENNNVDPST